MPKKYAPEIILSYGSKVLSQEEITSIFNGAEEITRAIEGLSGNNIASLKKAAGNRGLIVDIRDTRMKGLTGKTVWAIKVLLNMPKHKAEQISRGKWLTGVTSGETKEPT